MSDITEPPFGGRGPRGLPHKTIAASLKKKPKAWDKISVPRDMSREARRRLASNINTGAIKHYQPGGSFQATARNINGEVGVWVRYLGEDPE